MSIAISAGRTTVHAGQREKAPCPRTIHQWPPSGPYLLRLIATAHIWGHHAHMAKRLGAGDGEIEAIATDAAGRWFLSVGGVPCGGR